MYEMAGAANTGPDGARFIRRDEGHDGQCDIVIAMIAQEKRVPVRLLLHRSRCRMGASHARQLAMYLCHVALGRSLQAVGDVFGRDRTTVSHACALIEDLRDDRAFDSAVDALEQRIEATIWGGDHGAR